MKTQTGSFLTSITRITLLAILFTIAACKNNEGLSQNTDTQAKQPQTDIHTAIITDNIAALKQLIASHTDLNKKNAVGGSSPLISASLFGKTEMARMLINAGADLNLQNNEGSTALHTAAFFCRPEVLKLLLQKGADKTIKNKYGSTAYGIVSGPFAEVKNIYEMMGKMLAPMGLKLDFAYIEKTRPEIAALLK